MIPDEYDLVVGSWITVKRERAGWSQKKLASALGVSESCISRMEHGKTVVAAATLLRIIKVLNTLDLPIDFCAGSNGAGHGQQQEGQGRR